MLVRPCFSVKTVTIWSVSSFRVPSLALRTSYLSSLEQPFNNEQPARHNAKTITAICTLVSPLSRSDPVRNATFIAFSTRGRVEQVFLEKVDNAMFHCLVPMDENYIFTFGAGYPKVKTLGAAAADLPR